MDAQDGCRGTSSRPRRLTGASTQSNRPCGVFSGRKVRGAGLLVMRRDVSHTIDGTKRVRIRLAGTDTL